ncbi:MAG: hypothetical protein U0N90_12685, partial [Blautia sp.]
PISEKALCAAMRTRMKGRCQLKLTTLGAAKVCFLEENGIARVCEAHFCSGCFECFMEKWGIDLFFFCIFLF